MAYSAPDDMPQRAADLFTARNMQRALAWYRKAMRRAPRAELFNELVAVFESSPSRKELARLGALFDDLVEQLEGGPPRYAPGTAACVCKEPAKYRHYSSSLDVHVGTFDLWWMSKEDVKADIRVMERTRQHDVRTLAALSSRQLSATRTKDLGPLWPEGKPKWLTGRWPTRREFRKRDRRMWGEDRPVWRPRGAPRRHLSRRLPEAVLESLDISPFELEYRVEGDYSVPRNAPPGARLVGMTVPRGSFQTVVLRGRHRFRGPARPADLAAFRRRCGGSPVLAPAVAFYREHDGGFLYSAEGLPLGASAVELVGLREQERARRILLYGVQSDDIDDPERVPRFLVQVGAPERMLHVLALIGDVTLVVPLSGQRAGRVLRVGSAARPTAFAPDFPGALRVIRRKVVAISADTEFIQETAESDAISIPLMRLRRVRPVRG